RPPARSASATAADTTASPASSAPTATPTASGSPSASSGCIMRCRRTAPSREPAGGSGNRGPVSMSSTIQKLGQGLGVPIPASLARQAGLEEGTEVEITIRDGALVVLPARGYRLE